MDVEIYENRKERKCYVIFAVNREEMANINNILDIGCEVCAHNCLFFLLSGKKYI